ncbi:MAG: ral secretion pathway protein [Verrucomicrobiota bacterium]
MPNFRYRALTQSGEVVSGLLAAKSAQEVARRMDYLSLVPIEAIVEDEAGTPRIDFKFGKRVRPEDITTFTLDLALLLKAGARLDDALELLGNDIDIGRLHAIVSTIRSNVISGESFAEALAGHPRQFPPLYVALVSIGETSGALADMLQMLARERARDEALRRKIADALRYPVFLLFAAACVLMFFLTFVLPQFGAVLRDFGAQIDPVAAAFIWLSESIIAQKDAIAVITLFLLAGMFLAARQRKLRVAVLSRLVRMPLIRTVAAFHQTALFCRNLDILLAAAVPLTTTLRILADMMDGTGSRTVWSRVMERVRQGGRLSDAIDEARALPATAIRMLRLGEETGQLALLAGRVADFYETKLQRSIDRVVGFVGPAAIVIISVIIGGLIISVMTSLLSVSQLVG